MPEVRRSARTAAKAAAQDKPSPAKEASPKRPADSETPEAKKPKTESVSVGDKVPGDFTLTTDAEKEVKISELLAKPTVVFSFPKADTPGCTTQACSFRDSYSDLKKLGYDVIGISTDKPAALARWKEKKSFPYTLLSDPKSQLLSLLGWTAQNKRNHWVIGADAVLLEKALSVKPADDVANTIAFINNKAKL